jgi:hypothetical protein
VLCLSVVTLGSQKNTRLIKTCINYMSQAQRTSPLAGIPNALTMEPADDRPGPYRSCFFAKDSLNVTFINGTSSQQQNVRDWASEWSRYGNVKFQFTQSNGDIRIAFDDTM